MEEIIDETIDETNETKESEQVIDGEDLNKKLDELNDRLMRTLAEYDNFRKRTFKEKEMLYTDVKANTIEEFLPVLDNLERAVKAAEVAEDVSTIKNGIELILKQFLEVFAKLSVDEIPAVGEQFDPQMHNAVMHIEDDTIDHNTVVEQFQKGYKVKDKVIRHSMVKVAN